MKAIGFVLLATLTACPSFGLVRMAIFFGNNAGLADEKPLLYATRDAEQAYETFRELGGVEKDNAFLLLDPPVSKVMASFWEARKRVNENRKKGRTVQLLLYYSGHGGSDALHLNGEKLPLASIKDYFRESEADLKLLIADACFSGSLIQDKGATLAPPAPLKYVDELSVNGSAILTSSTAGEMSQESKALRGSVFTYHFLTALRGAGDLDHDGKVSLWEAYSHTQAGLRRQMAGNGGTGTQTPVFDMDIRGSESVILTHLDKGQAFLSLKGLPFGLYRILEAGTASQVGEIGISDSSGMELALPRAAYLVYRIHGGEGMAGYADLRKHSRVRLGAGDLRPVPAGQFSSKGMLGPESLGRLGRGPLHLALEPRWYPSFPGRGAPALAFEIAARGNWRDLGASLGGGYLPGFRDKAGVNRFEQNAWFLAGEGRYYWSYSRWGAAFAGPRLESWSVGQTINGVEYPRGSLLGTFALLGFERTLFRSLSWHASLGGGYFWSYDPEGALNRDLSFPISLALRFGP